MTKEEIKEAAKVMEAYANGKKIQCNDNHLGNGEWVTTDNPSFNWDKYAYRIKPEPKYRPFESQEECWNEMHKHPDFGWVVTKNCRVMYHIDSIFNALSIGYIGYSFDDMYQKFEFLDGTPFGVKEEE